MIIDPTDKNRALLLELTTQVASAFVRNNTINAEDVPVLIGGVYMALEICGEPKAPAESPREPAVSIRASVKPDSVTCLECGKSMKMLKRHLSTDHGMTPEEYRVRWNLPASHPLVAPNYAEVRRELAKKIGLGRVGNPARGRKGKI